MSVEEQQHGLKRRSKDVSSARSAAEALFKPRKRLTETAAAAAAPSEQVIREPRVLSVLKSGTAFEQKANPITVEKEAKLSLEDAKPSPTVVSNVEKIRTWLKYGMTLPQVSEVCGIEINEIKRLLEKKNI